MSRPDPIESLRDLVGARSDGELAKRIGVERSSISHWRSRGVPKALAGVLPFVTTRSPSVSLEDLEDLVRAFVRLVAAAGGDPVPEDLRAPAEEPDPAFVSLPYHQDVRAAAGSGELVFEEDADFRFDLRRELVPGWASADRLSCIRAKGDSMEPTIHDGDFIVVDLSVLDLVTGEVFAVHNHDDGLLVKRARSVRRRSPSLPPGVMGFMTTRPLIEWHLVSDNEAYPARRVSSADRVVGRVAWSGPRSPDQVR